MNKKDTHRWDDPDEMFPPEIQEKIDNIKNNNNGNKTKNEDNNDE